MLMNPVGALGLGAGIFNGLGVLGQDSDYVYQWGQYSDGTMSQQIAANFELEQAGMPPIGEDGVLGAETCGAEAWIVANLPGSAVPHRAFLMLADCRSFDYPRAAPPVPVTVVETAPPPETTPSSRRASMSTTGWLLIAAGAAATGIYLSGKRKRR